MRPSLKSNSCCLLCILLIILLEINSLYRETYSFGSIPAQETIKAGESNRTKISIDEESLHTNLENQTNYNNVDTLTSSNDAIENITWKHLTLNNTKIIVDNSQEFSHMTKNTTQSANGNLNSNATATIQAESSRSRIATSPWTSIAPRLDVLSLPDWLQDYVDWHNQAERDILSNSSRSSDYNYIIYTCRKGGGKCSGTGNRQRGIMALLLVDIVTKRMFFMDVDNPIELSKVLEPHLIQWDCDYYRKSNVMNDMKSNPCWHDNVPVANLRNVNPNPLENPTEFAKDAPTVLRVLNNGPSGLDGIWRSPDTRQFMGRSSSFKVEDASSTPPLYIYKWLFYTLFKPSKALSDLVHQQQQQLGIVVNATYIGMHVRLGDGEASWRKSQGIKEDERYNVTALPKFLELGYAFQKQLGELRTPIVVVSDNEDAKMALRKLEPTHIRYLAGTQLIHIDRSHLTNRELALQGMLQTWADMLLLAQSTCLVLSYSSFSDHAARISMPETKSGRCMTTLVEGRWGR